VSGWKRVCVFDVFPHVGISSDRVVHSRPGGREGGREGGVRSNGEEEREGEKVASVLPCHGSLLGNWALGH